MPGWVKIKRQIAAATRTAVITIEIISMLVTSNIKIGEVRTPLVLKVKLEIQEMMEEKNRFIPRAAIN